MTLMQIDWYAPEVFKASLKIQYNKAQKKKNQKMRRTNLSFFNVGCTRGSKVARFI